MTPMHFAIATSEQFGREVFAFPSTIVASEIIKVIGYIRHGERHNWKRIKRTLIQSGVVGEGVSIAELFATEMKYIVAESNEAGKQMFIFPKKINHDSMAEVLSEIEESIGEKEPDNFYREPMSAGFFDGKACYGKSETLNLPSSKTDTLLFQSGGFSQQ